MSACPYRTLLLILGIHVLSRFSDLTIGTFIFFYLELRFWRPQEQYISNGPSTRLSGVSYVVQEHQ